MCPTIVDAIALYLVGRRGPLARAACQDQQQDGKHKFTHKLQICFNVEARAGLSGKLVVAVDRGTGVLGTQKLYQVAQCRTLCGCAGVLWGLAVNRHASDIAHADTVSVVAAGVRADLLDGAAWMHAAVTVYDVVVAYALPASLLVPAVNICHRVVAALGRRAAVQNNLSNFSHTYSV